MVNLFSTGYVSDSAAFVNHSMKVGKGRAQTRIRKSRITNRPTPRNHLVNRVSRKLIDEIVEDDIIINRIVQQEKLGSDWLQVFRLWKKGEDVAPTSRQHNSTRS